MRQDKPLILLLLVSFVVLIGVCGYMWIEGWTFGEAFYMTIITLTTTGFREVRLLSDSGRYFTSFLLIIGVGTVAFSATQIMGSVLSINFKVNRRKRMESQIQSLSQHSIVCGYGGMGQVICNELEKAKFPFVVIEPNEDRLSRLEESNHFFIHGDAADDENLIKAGIEKAKVLISTLSNDHDALYLALAARSLSTSLQIIVRASNESARKKIMLAGANKVVLPYQMSGVRVADAVVNPAGEDYFDFTGAKVDDEARYRLGEFYVEENSKLIGKSLRTFTIKDFGLIVVGIKKVDDSFMFAPDADYQFQEGDCLISFGKVSSLENLKQSLKVTS